MVAILQLFSGRDELFQYIGQARQIRQRHGCQRGGIRRASTIYPGRKNPKLMNWRNIMKIAPGYMHPILPGCSCCVLKAQKMGQPGFVGLDIFGCDNKIYGDWEGG